MKFLEKDLEDIIFEAPREELAKRGLHIEGKMYRQLRIGNYGIADLVTIQRPIMIPDGKNYYDFDVQVECDDDTGEIMIYELPLKKESEPDPGTSDAAAGEADNQSVKKKVKKSKTSAKKKTGRRPIPEPSDVLDDEEDDDLPF